MTRHALLPDRGAWKRRPASALRHSVAAIRGERASLAARR